MAIWIDDKFINLISPQLKKFKRVDNTTYTFRCPYCGDSEKDQTKTRGYFFEKKGAMRFFCHNCGKSVGVRGFLYDNDPSLYKQYQLETYTENGGKSTRFDKKPEPPKKDPVRPNTTLLDGLMPSIASLPPEHIARAYIEGERKIPARFYDDIFYIDDMRKIGNLKPKYREKLKVAEERVVVPIRGRSGQLVAVSCRALDKNATLRYIEIPIDDDAVPIYGLDRVNLSKKIYVFEGAFDSMFFENAVAVNGSALKKIQGQLPKQNCVLVYDAQPRNKELVSQIRGAISLGYTVALCPETGYKDINLMVQNGILPVDIKKMIDENTFQGLAAEMQFSRWKKV